MFEPNYNEVFVVSVGNIWLNSKSKSKVPVETFSLKEIEKKR